MHNRRWIVVLLHVLVAVHVVCHTVQGFNFVPSGPFPCMCADHGPCDPFSGQCDQGQCVTAVPASYGWGGYGCLTGNVAFGKTAIQNGDNNTSEEYAAWNAVDGVVSQENATDAERSVCARVQVPPSNGTNCSMECGNAWWQVDLGGMYYVREVTVHNTYIGHDIHQLQNVDVRVGNTSEVGSYQYELCGWIQAYALSTDVPCHTEPVGRYVTLYKYKSAKDGSDSLGDFTVCEVIVNGNLYNDCTDCEGVCTGQYGCVTCPSGFNASTLCNTECDDGFYGQSCREQCGQCVVRPGQPYCDKRSGVCTHGCQVWWVSDTCNQEIVQIDLQPNSLHLLSRDLTVITVTWAAAAGIPPDLASHYGYKMQVKRSPGTASWMTAHILDHESGRVYREAFWGLMLNTVYDIRVVPYRTDRDHVDHGTAAMLTHVSTLCGHQCDLPDGPNGGGSSDKNPTRGPYKATDDCDCGLWQVYMGLAVGLLCISLIINIVTCIKLYRKHPLPRIRFRNERSSSTSTRTTSTGPRRTRTTSLDNNVPIMRTHERAVENDYMMNLDPMSRTRSGTAESSSMENEDAASLDALGDAPLPPRLELDEYVDIAEPSERYEQIY